MPILYHTWKRAREALETDHIFIAAGDPEICAAALQWGAEVVEVYEDCPSGSDRVWRALQRLHLQNPVSHHTIILNIQGDQPLLEPKVLTDLVNVLSTHPEAGVATPAAPILSLEEFRDPSVVKVVFDRGGRALYFSRATIPFPLHQSGEVAGFHHIGIYAYRRWALEQFAHLTPSPLEMTESLEQLRFLEAGIPVQVVLTDKAPLEINTPEDYQRLLEIEGGESSSS